MNAPKILFLDIETAPHRVYCWGLWGQDIHIDQIEEPGYTLCWAAQWADDKKMMFSSIKGAGRGKMLVTMHRLLEEADIVVHYNGTKFDIPTLNQEFMLVGLRPPAPYKQVDLLLVVRRQFRLASNKLNYVARVLGIGSKLQHKGMGLWKECMAGDPAAWAVMERYNKQDVKLLVKVYNKLLPWISDHPNVGLWIGDDASICTNCGSRNLQRRGFSRAKTRMYQRFQCNDCGSWMRARLGEKGRTVKVTN